MSDFPDVTKHLDLLKSRQATADEAKNATQPFDKYYGLSKSRDIKKIYTYLVLPTFQVLHQNLNFIRRRLLFQYNIVAPKSFYILNNSTIFQRGVNFKNCFICIKWRVGTNVFRYRLTLTPPVDAYSSNPFKVDLNPYFEIYNNQLISKNCVIEVWEGRTEPIISSNAIVGLIQDISIQTSILSNPQVADDIEIDLQQIVTPFVNLSFNLPMNLPQDQSTLVFNNN